MGHAVPAPAMVLFTNADGSPCERPCLFGIRVGKTFYTDAIDLLRRHPFTHNYEPNIEGDILRGESMNIILVVDDNDRIVLIELTNRTNAGSTLASVSLGEVISHLGAPDAVENEGEFTASYYAAQRLIFSHRTVAPNKISIDQPFEAVTVYATTPEIPSASIPWEGFRAESR